LQLFGTNVSYWKHNFSVVESLFLTIHFFERVVQDYIGAFTREEESETED